jgi:hypothetical protein
MNGSDSHAPSESPRERARQLIIRDLGVKRVAGWCQVGEATVHKWLERATDEQPVPTGRIPAIIAGAKSDGLEAPLELLWPAMHAAQGVAP